MASNVCNWIKRTLPRYPDFQANGRRRHDRNHSPKFTALVAALAAIQVETLAEHGDASETTVPITRVSVARKVRNGRVYTRILGETRLHTMCEGGCCSSVHLPCCILIDMYNDTVKVYRYEHGDDHFEPRDHIETTLDADAKATLTTMVDPFITHLF
jgi:hypothetical protein